MKLTREEALELMKQGKRVRHYNFTRYEYLEMIDGRIMTEDGFRFDDIFSTTSWMANSWYEYQGPDYDPAN